MEFLDLLKNLFGENVEVHVVDLTDTDKVAHALLYAAQRLPPHTLLRAVAKTLTCCMEEDKRNLEEAKKKGDEVAIQKFTSLTLMFEEVLATLKPAQEKTEATCQKYLPHLFGVSPEPPPFMMGKTGQS